MWGIFLTFPAMCRDTNHHVLTSLTTLCAFLCFLAYNIRLPHPDSATTTPRGSPPASMTTSRAVAAVVAVAARAAEESLWTVPRRIPAPARPSRPERPSDGAALGSGACFVLLVQAMLACFACRDTGCGAVLAWVGWRSCGHHCQCHYAWILIVLISQAWREHLSKYLNSPPLSTPSSKPPPSQSTTE